MRYYLDDNGKKFFERTVLIVLTFLLSALGNEQVLPADELLERRVEALEQYVTEIQPTLSEMSENINSGLEEYTKSLESGLEGYARTLQANLDQRIEAVNRKTAVLNPYSRDYQSVETGAGLFLIAIDKVDPVEGGVRLHLNIGNPSYADYNGFKLKVFWGRTWAGPNVEPYGQWRQALNGAEYEFQGKIEKGKWNAMEVELSPAEGGRIGYLECEITVSSVELGVN